MLSMIAFPELVRFSMWPIFHPQNKWPFTRVTVLWIKGNNQTLQGILFTVSKLTLTPRDPKCHSALLVKIGAYGKQWSFSSGPSNSGPNESPNLSCGYFPSSGIHHQNRHLSNWQDPHSGTLSPGMSNVWMRDQEKGVQEVGVKGRALWQDQGPREEDILQKPGEGEKGFVGLW